MTTWEHVAARRIFRVVNGGTPTADAENWDGGVPWATPVDLGQFNGSLITSTARNLSRQGLEKGSAAVQADSLVVSTRALIGYVSQTTALLAFNQGCRGLAPTVPVDIRFYRYVFISLAERLQACGQGSTFVELSSGALASMPVPLPPMSAQRAIADYLDVEIARIEALIEKKRQMVELLEEAQIRLSFDLISGTSTSGQRKPCALPWLADVPASWDVAPVSSRFSVQLGRMLNAERASTGEMRPYLRNINVRWNSFDLTDVAEMDFPSGERRKYLLSPGDLIVCEGGAGVGRAAVWQGEMEECYFQKSLHRVRPIQTWPVEWLLEWLRVAKWMNVLAVEGNLATIPHLTAEQLRVCRIPMPGESECRHLLAVLDARRARLEMTSKAHFAQMNLLAEHRQAVITAAVTGDLDIPGVAA